MQTLIHRMILGLLRSHPEHCFSAADIQAVFAAEFVALPNQWLAPYLADLEKLSIVRRIADSTKTTRYELTPCTSS